MYYHPMPAETQTTFRVEAGTPAMFYPAAAPMRDRRHPGLRFDLSPAAGWTWAGDSAPVPATLTDVLAAINNARLDGLPGLPVLADVQAAHEHATRTVLNALAGPADTALVTRFMQELGEVAASALVSEDVAAYRLGITGRSLNNLRLSARTICPPVFIAGDRRTKWFWAPAQFTAWQQARPGRGWKGHQERRGPRAGTG